MSEEINKCNECNRIIWSRQKIINCAICKSYIHRKCLYSLRRSVSISSLNSNPYYCNKCVNVILPFQSVNDVDITTVCRESLRDIVQRFNCLDGYLSDQDGVYENNIKPCKYYNPHELSNIYHENDLRDGFSLLLVNIRSLHKNLMNSNYF